MTKVEETIAKMMEYLKQFKGGFNARDIIYRNEETGLVVVDGTHTGTFYTANPEGFAMSSYFCYYEAYLDVGKVEENDKEVIVPVEGSITSYWEITCSARDIIFKKNEFTKWGEEIKKLVNFY